MWDGVTYVDPNHDPIIHEGRVAATAIVTNAGPCDILIRGWRSTKASGDPDIQLRLFPGNTRSVSSELIRAKVVPGDRAPPPFPPPFAAIGWRIVK
jgi:hypothetical protein